MSLDKTDPMAPPDGKIVLSLRDTTCKITLNNVHYVCCDPAAVTVAFNDNSVRCYPLVHLWYWEFPKPEDKS